MLQIINTAVLLILAVATLLPVLRIRHWLVRGLDFPRLQLFLSLVALAVLVLVQTYFNQPMPIIWWLLLAALIVNHIWWIWPYTPLHSVQVPEQDPLSTNSKQNRVCLLSCNVLMTNRDSQHLLATIERHSPDVIAILESDHWWQEQLDVLSDYPYRVACPLTNKYGMHLYSRLKIRDSRIDFLVEPDVPSISAAVELGSGQTFHLHIIHPRPPAPGENEFSTARDIELLVLARALEDVDKPVIVTGDLNDVAWSRTTRLFRRVSRLLDPRTGRGLFNTFHADHWFMRWPLDHVFVSTHFRVCDIKRLEHVGSDHFPMLVNLAMSAPDLIDEPASPTEEEKELMQDTLQTSLAESAKSPVITQILPA